MFYKVRARLKTDTAAELRRKLLDGTIQRQKPDGQEIVDSMRRAVASRFTTRPLLVIGLLATLAWGSFTFGGDMPVAQAAGPDFRIIDVRAEYGQMVVEVEHLMT